MRAHIITIGDEILIGQTLNTNAAYIGEELIKTRIQVYKSTVVGDNEDEIISEIRNAFNNCDIVIATGGLGPTHDDVTKSSIVKYFNTELIQNDSVLQDIKTLFEKRGRVMADVNLQQAMVPKVAEIIRNNHGTAPGMWIKKDEKIFISMPGVPYEMQEMMQDFVLPKFRQLEFPDTKVRKIKNLLTTGIPESTLFERLGNIDELLTGSKLAFLPNQYGVKMRITVEDNDEETASNKLFEIEQKIRSAVGRYIYGKENESLEEVIGRLLNERDMTLSIAESCTGGLICNRITNIGGSSNYFDRGIVAYSNAAKVELLQVDEDALQEHGAVSIEVARQMADGVRHSSGADIGLSITGILGPTAGNSDKAIGLVFVGISDENICTARKFTFGDERILNKDRTSQAALDMLRRHLLGIPYDE